MNGGAWDSPAWRELRDQHLRRWLLDDAAAVACVVLISSISETWDDLIDRDRRLDPASINQAFVNALLVLPNNPFYATHRAFLEPVMLLAINAWLDAEVLVREPAAQWRMLAFYLRNYLAEIIQACACLQGGWQHMRAISLEVRAFLAHETYFDWEHRHADIPA